MKSRDTTPEEDATINKMIYVKFSHFIGKVFGPGYCVAYNRVAWPKATKYVLINVETKTVFNIWWNRSDFRNTYETFVYCFVKEKKNYIRLSTTTPYLLLENYS